MDSIKQVSNSYASSLGNFVLNGIDLLQQHTGLKTAAALGGATSKSAVSKTASSLIGESAASSDTKKIIGISVVTGAVIIGSAYVGYQLARKRHRFHVVPTDKTENV